MRTLILLSLPAALALAGCAAAVPGFVPPSAKTERREALLPKGGGLGEDGTYALSEQEQKLDCKRLTGSVKIKIVQLRDARGREGPKLIAGLAQKAMQPFLGGSPKGLDKAQDDAEDKARLVALNRQLAAKGCRSFDLEKELSPGNMAPPAPTVAATKG